MNKISVKKAIETGDWYSCNAKYFDDDLQYKLRVLGFNRTTVEEIDETLMNTVIVEGILWLAHIEVVNLCKQPVVAWEFSQTLVLIDEDEFQFEPFNNGDLSQNKESGLCRFSDWSDIPSLSPKIKAIGSIAFVLPDEENNYYLAVKEGQIKEA